MGQSTSKDMQRQYEKSRFIDMEMQAEAVSNLQMTKLLLLGPGESGKSTITKQFRILRAQGFSYEDLVNMTPIVYDNVVHSMFSILCGMEKLHMFFENYNLEVDAALVNKYARLGHHARHAKISRDLYSSLKRLWHDPGVQNCFKRGADYQLLDCAKYFLDSLERICAPGYVPSLDDVLHARQETTCIVQTEFMAMGLNFRLIDVGGQRTQRKKWLHCFDDVKCILFVASVNEYDQVMREDNQTPRMRDALQLFELICNHALFKQTGLILFLNKIDLFREKVSQVPITTFFKRYAGPYRYEEALEYIRDVFVSCNKNMKRLVFPHFTCATDTTQFAFVLDSVLQTIMVDNLHNCGVA